MEEQTGDAPAKGVYAKANASRFHFKAGSKRRSRRRHGSNDGHEDPEEGASKYHRSGSADESRRSHGDARRRYRQSHRSSHTNRDVPRTGDGEYYDPNRRYRESLYDDLDQAGTGPSDAFRESLFDALADDEGAAYWEGVYGQPVHVYPDMKPGPHGKLERMNEEEYADYVRTKMWEKSHQHILEEREARKKARQEKKDQREHLDEGVSRYEAERETIRKRMEESLRRGEERKKAKVAEAAWDNYLKKWDDLKNAQNHIENSESKVADLLPWPVFSGNAKHVSKEEIERFLRSSNAWKEDSFAVLKVERVRWHPDKMQQRFGKHIDTDTMGLVTAVFQVIDQLWNDRQ